MNEKEAIWFGGWDAVLEVVLVTPVIYALVIVFVRISGKQTTGQMNNFDWIVTVAMGSIVASGIVINSVEVIEAAAAVGMLIGLQFALTWIAKRRECLDRFVKAEPRMLVCRGELNEQALRDERITMGELSTALRQNGITRLDQIEWLLLENTGTFTVITKDAARAGVDTIVTTKEIEADRQAL